MILPPILLVGAIAALVLIFAIPFSIAIFGNAHRRYEE